MSLSLWTVNCRGIPKELLAPAVRWRQALDASAIHGRLGAQVALLQSPILRAGSRECSTNAELEQQGPRNGQD